MKKRLFTLLLALCLALSLLPAPATHAAGSITWSVYRGVLTVSGSGAMDDYQEDWRSPLYNHTDFKKIVVEPGITHIGSCFFYNCTSVESVELPDTVRSIGYMAFNGCTALKEIRLPEGLEKIDRWAFEGCHELREVTIPASVTAFGSDGFSPFTYCWGLTAINVAPGNPNYCSEDGILYNADKTTLLACPGGRAGALTIPASVTTVSAAALEGCKHLTSVEIGPQVRSFGSYAFSGCNGLTEVRISDLNAWCTASFADAGANPLTCAKKLVVNGKPLGDSLTIPGSISRVGDHAFIHLESIRSLTVEPGVTEIGDRAFACCTTLEDVSLPGTLETIGIGAFGSCTALREITVPEGVRVLGESAFYQCAALERIALPKSLEKIGSSAFGECKALREASAPDLAAWCEIDFGGYFANPVCCTGTILIGGKPLTEAIIPDTVTRIGCWAFANCASLTKVVIPSSVTELGECAFSGCANLTDLTIEPGLQEIGESAFSECSGLAKLELPDTVNSILRGAFSNCTALRTVTIPAGMVGIDRGAFHGCSALETVRYGGTREQWADIYIEPDNNPLLYAALRCAGEDAPQTFRDVRPDAYYAHAVAWAVEKGVTNGTGPDTFSPAKPCTRAQIVTFLWRAAGCPKPRIDKCPFEDVKPGAYYYDAVLWAAGRNITKGVTSTRFDPDATVTRAQTVTFLWRAEYRPDPNSQRNPFTDVPDGKFYTKAVLWAVSRRITNGTSETTFSPGDPCTRGQIVTFLYRCKTGG